MAHMSRRFNFDDFDELCREALDPLEVDEAAELEERLADCDRVFYPGEIGGVVVKLSSHSKFLEDPDLPPEAA